MLVLDTNAVLDWLVFGDPATLPIASAILSGSAIWRLSAPMRREIEHVLTFKSFGPRSLEPDVILRMVDDRSTVVDAERAGTDPRLQCRDRDDQKFIDLAVALRPSTLITRDRDVLALRRRALELHGVRIIRPAEWQPSDRQASDPHVSAAQAAADR